MGSWFSLHIFVVMIKWDDPTSSLLVNWTRQGARNRQLRSFLQCPSKLTLPTPKPNPLNYMLSSDFHWLTKTFSDIQKPRIHLNQNIGLSFDWKLVHPLQLRTGWNSLPHREKELEVGFLPSPQHRTCGAREGRRGQEVKDLTWLMQLESSIHCESYQTLAPFHGVLLWAPWRPHTLTGQTFWAESQNNQVRLPPHLTVVTAKK